MNSDQLFALGTLLFILAAVALLWLLLEELTGRGRR